MHGLGPSPVELFFRLQGGVHASSAPCRARAHVKRGPSVFHARRRVGSPAPGGGYVSSWHAHRDVDLGPHGPGSHPGVSD